MQSSPSHLAAVVLDDDPTGTQTMHGVRVLLAWDVPTLESTIRHLQARREPCRVLRRV